MFACFRKFDSRLASSLTKASLSPQIIALEAENVATGSEDTYSLLGESVISMMADQGGSPELDASNFNVSLSTFILSLRPRR